MDPDLQEAFSDVESSIYRTALKICSVQSLCQLDLIDISLIQHILSSEQSQREEQISLNTQQISRMLMKLFQRARLEKPGQVDPRAAEFSLGLLIAMYDRYRCLKCLNFDLCQACFFTGHLCKPHKRSHPVVEHCVQMSAKANAKHFLHTIRNNLFQECCRRKEAQRRTALESVEERHIPAHKKTFPPVEFSGSSLPGPENVSFPVDSCVPESPRFVPENRTVMQKSENNKTPEQGKTIAQAIACFEADVLKMHESIKSIHSDSRYMKKQFDKWKDKMQFLHNCQEEKSCKIEAKLQRLRTILQSSEHPFAQCHNTMPSNPHVLLERRMQSELNPAQIRPISRTCAEWKYLNPPNSVNRMQLLQTPEVPTAVDVMFSDHPLESVSLQSDKTFMGRHKQAKEKQTYLPKLTENSLGGMGNTVLISTAMQTAPDEKEVRQELELLMMKLKDALSLQTQPAQQTALHQEFFSTAEHVCKSFSDLINQVISPACK
ncbi:putative malate dehydrogenase 1B isoform X2 [Passer domesticus]|uniref:putative malate dehydrogenase 1B isoform X2 n=1 Tax=Passer domesticus TaxID=48849 RepID=UPI0030FF0ED9